MFGLLRMCQLVLPGMRAQRWGKIVNISSMGGRLTFPGGGLYHATKYAVEAMSDALRFEVRGFGVDVILIEPGLIVTNFGEVAAGSVGDGPATTAPYAEFNRKVAEITEEPTRARWRSSGRARRRSRRRSRARSRPGAPGRAIR